METEPGQDREASIDHIASDPDGASRQLADVITRGTPVMMVTTGPDGLGGRPLICCSAENHTLRFVVDRRAAWMAELQEIGDATAGLIVVSDPTHSTFVWSKVDITVARGRGAVDALWNPAVAAFFDGPDDPDLVILVVEGNRGQWWDGPSSALGRAVAITQAAVTQNPDPLADHGQFG